MKDIIKEIFKQIDGYTCRINSGGLHAQGSTEGECLLSYSDHHGLVIKSLLKWNDFKPQDLVLPCLNRHLKALQKESDPNLTPIDFDARDQIYEALKQEIESSYVTVGLISLYGIKSISCTNRDKDESIYGLEIQYEHSKVSIYSLSKKT